MNCKNYSKETTKGIEIHGGSRFHQPINDAKDVRVMLAQYLQAMINLASDSHTFVPRTDKWEFRCYEEIVLKYGRYYEPASASDLPTNFHIGRPESNFKNAFDLMGGGLIYSEGYVVLRSGNNIINHAWVIHKKSQHVIDPTYRNIASVYFGIPFRREFVLSRAAETMRAGIFENDLDTACPILVHGLPPSATWNP